MVIPDYELYYDAAESINILDVLQNIEQDLSSINSLHNWDDKWSLDSVKTLARFAKRELDRLSQRAASHIINFSSLDRIWTVNGNNRRMPFTPDRANMKCHFLASEVRSAARN